MSVLELSQGGPRGLARRYFSLARGFWSGSTRRSAWLLSSGFLGCLIVNNLLAVAVNRWSKYFFDALQSRDIAALKTNTALIAVLALGVAAMSVALIQMRMRLQLAWRTWLTQALVGRWLGNRRFYQLSILNTVDNPDARIAEDGRVSVDLFVDLAGGIINTFLIAASFLFILWYVGGSLQIGGWTIPAYFVIAVVVYTGVTSLGMFALGRPLVARVEEKSAGEGDFRHALTRTRENAEAIALIGGDEDERKILEGSFAQLAERWRAVIVVQTRMMFLSSGNGVLAAAFPLLLGAPKYLAGQMTLGDLMQVSAAFAQVQLALNWLADNALSLANWSASARRVGALDLACEELDNVDSMQEGQSIVLEDGEDDALHLDGLSISQFDGKLMLSESNVKIQMGEKLLVKGDSGSGKSTLIRAMAGLWPWGTGRILRPRNAHIVFMPQRPYLPLGTLRTALAYPDTDKPLDDAAITQIMEQCGLEHLLPRLDEEAGWSGILSGGEQQRFGFARVFLRRPDIVIMDEATSALDELSQKRMMELMGEKLAHSMVIHVAHRPGLDRYHTRELVLKRQRGGAAVVRDSEDRSVIDRVLGRFR